MQNELENRSRAALELGFENLDRFARDSPEMPEMPDMRCHGPGRLQMVRGWTSRSGRSPRIQTTLKPMMAGKEGAQGLQEHREGKHYYRTDGSKSH